MSSTAMTTAAQLAPFMDSEARDTGVMQQDTSLPALATEASGHEDVFLTTLKSILVGKPELVASTDHVHEALMIPKDICQQYMPALAMDGNTIYMCLAVAQLDKEGQLRSIQRDRVLITFRPNQPHVLLLGADTTSTLGKRILGWSILECPDLSKDADGRPCLPSPSGDLLPLSTTQMIVLQLEWVDKTSVAAEKQPPGAVVPVVVGVPLFQGANRVGMWCAHCGDKASILWQPGWQVPANKGQTHAEVNLCEGCAHDYTENPNHFIRTIARTTGAINEPVVGEWGSPVQGGFPRSQRHGTHDLHPSQSVDTLKAQQGDGHPQPASAGHAPQGLPMLECPVFMGTEHSGATSCAWCRIQASSRWAPGWPLRRQDVHQDGGVPLGYANLCVGCGEEYAQNPSSFLQSCDMPFHQDQQQPYNATHADTFAEPWAIVVTRPQGSIAPGNLVAAGRQGGSMGKAHLQDVQAAGAGRAARKRRPPAWLEDAGAVAPGIAHVSQRPPAAPGSTSLLSGSVSMGGGVPRKQSRGGSADVEDISDPRLAAALAAVNARRQRGPDGTGGYDLQLPGNPGMRRGGVYGASTLVGTAAWASAVGAPLEQEVTEIPIVGQQSLIVPMGLVRRDFRQALHGQDCFVRMVYYSGDAYLASSQEWVQLKEHSVTKQVHVEGASLLPVFGKVIVGWKSTDPVRVPGRRPVASRGQLHWQDPNSGQLLPLSTDKVLVLRLRDARPGEVLTASPAAPIAALATVGMAPQVWAPTPCTSSGAPSAPLQGLHSIEVPPAAVMEGARVDRGVILHHHVTKQRESDGGASKGSTGQPDTARLQDGIPVPAPKRFSSVRAPTMHAASQAAAAAAAQTSSQNGSQGGGKLTDGGADKTHVPARRAEGGSEAGSGADGMVHVVALPMGGRAAGMGAAGKPAVQEVDEMDARATSGADSAMMPSGDDGGLQGMIRSEDVLGEHRSAEEPNSRGTGKVAGAVQVKIERLGSKGEKGSRAADDGDFGFGAVGDVLDTLRPIVVGLREQLREQGGLPSLSLSEVWVAVNKLTVDQVGAFQKHSLPWIVSLWEEHQWEECSRLIQRMLKMKAMS